MKKFILTFLLLTGLHALSQTHLFNSISFVAGGVIQQCAFAPTSLTFNNINYVAFPGFGTSHTTAAYGDHAHGVYGQWVTNGTNIYNSNSGNVGVGTTNPTHKLTVVGGTYGINSYGSVTGVFSQGGSWGVQGSGATGIYGVGTAKGGEFSSSSGTALYASTTTGLAGIFMGGNVGIGVTNPSALLQVNGLLKTTTLQVGPYNVSVTGNVSIPQSGGGTVTNVTGIAPVYVDHGTTEPVISMPAASSDVDGYLTGWDWNMFYYKRGSQWEDYGDGSIYFPGDYVGIRTPKPAYPLDVNGNVRSSESFITKDGTSDDWNAKEPGLGYPSADGLVLSSLMDGTRSWTSFPKGLWTENGYDVYRASGRVGVNTTSPQFTLDVAGTAKISDYKSYESYVSQLNVNAGTSSIGGIWTNATDSVPANKVPGYLFDGDKSTGYINNHSVVVNPFVGSYFYYFSRSRNYSYQVGIFDGSEQRKAFCSMQIGGPTFFRASLGSPAYPWGKAYFADSMFCEKITSTGIKATTLVTTGKVGIGTTNQDSTLNVGGGINASGGLSATGMVIIKNPINESTIQMGPGGFYAVTNVAGYAAANIQPYGAEGRFRFRRTNGTYAAKTALVSGNEIGHVGWCGFEGSILSAPKAQITGYSTENWSATANGTNILFHTTKNGTTSTAEVMRLENNRCVQINTPVSIGSNPLQVTMDAAVYGNTISPIFIETYSTGGAQTFTTRTAQGTKTSPTALTDGVTLGGIGSRGHDGTSWTTNRAGINIKADGNWTTTSHGTMFVITLTSPGAIASSEKHRFTASGLGILTVSAPTAALDVNSDIIRVRSAKVPASASATGNAGDICWGADYIYICVAENTWKRSPLTTW